MPLQRILAATDFSRASDRALRRAALLAQTHHATLDILHVQPHTPLGDAWQLLAENLGTNGKLGDDEHSREAAHAELTARAARVHQDTGVTSHVKLDEGRPARVIAERAKGADLVVIGAHGQHALRELFVGSTAQKLLRLTPCPVLLVKQSPPFDYERILLPTDFSGAALAAARWARDTLPDSLCHLLHSYELPFAGKLQYAGVSEDVIEHCHDEARARLRRELDAFAHEAGFAPGEAVRKVQQGYAPARIVDYAGEIQADLIVLAASGKSGAEHLFLGSVSLHVALEAGCDVLVLHAPGAHA